MAENGLINRMPVVSGLDVEGRGVLPANMPAISGLDVESRGVPPVNMPTRVAIPSEVPLWAVGAGGGSGYQQWDEGVDEIAMAFKNYLTQNPHADRNAPNIDTFDAFRAGVEFGRTPPVEEFGKPYVPPNVDEFEGIATEGTPGFVSPDYRQQPPSSFSLDPNDPRNAYLNQGVPAQMQPTEDFRIDMSDILGTPRG
jgi:hypothetical protein|tara:strand:- start:4 stop:594 length:591 start_codon:yes stop_codon:yes gene_type:complete